LNTVDRSAAADVVGLTYEVGIEAIGNFNVVYLVDNEISVNTDIILVMLVKPVVIVDSLDVLLVVGTECVVITLMVDLIAVGPVALVNGIVNVVSDVDNESVVFLGILDLLAVTVL